MFCSASSFSRLEGIGTGFGEDVAVSNWPELPFPLHAVIAVHANGSGPNHFFQSH